MIFVDIVGFMVLWGISYNVVFFINLVLVVGMFVEFVFYIICFFVISIKFIWLERVKEVIIFMGSVVFVGVVMINFFGILVLGFVKV